MDNAPFLENYSGEKPETLLGMEGKFRRDSLILALEQAIDRKRLKFGDASLSEEELTVLSVCALEREVNNGGYNQFFLNPSNAFADRIVQDLRRIGCQTAARITESAIQALEVETLEPEVLKERAMQDDDNFLAKQEACDAEYYRAGDQIEKGLFDFVKANCESFSFPMTIRIGAWLESKLRR